MWQLILLLFILYFIFRNFLAVEPPKKQFFQVTQYDLTYKSSRGYFELDISTGIDDYFIDTLLEDKNIKKVERINHSLIHIFPKPTKEEKASKFIHAEVTEEYGMDKLK